MRIYDPGEDRALDEVYILLTPEEAHQMRDFLSQSLEDYDKPGEHFHVSEFDLESSVVKHEVTFSIYTESNLKYYAERFRRLIIEDK